MHSGAWATLIVFGYPATARNPSQGRTTLTPGSALQFGRSACPTQRQCRHFGYDAGRNCVLSDNFI